jgi:hypothetical protein
LTKHIDLGRGGATTICILLMAILVFWVWFESREDQAVPVQQETAAALTLMPMGLPFVTSVASLPGAGACSPCAPLVSSAAQNPSGVGVVMG